MDIKHEKNARKASKMSTCLGLRVDPIGGTRRDENVTTYVSAVPSSAEVWSRVDIKHENNARNFCSCFC